MDYHFKRCLEKKNLVKVEIDQGLIDKELAAAESDLRDSTDVLKAGKIKWATISAYYSMFHASRALLYSKGYRERSHFCLRAALKNLYIRGQKPRPLRARMENGRSVFRSTKPRASARGASFRGYQSFRVKFSG